tara:strand:- start:2046 stop:2207 length:162 start_codon:yes stop_codon:yes gene_type:complete
MGVPGNKNQSAISNIFNRVPCCVSADKEAAAIGYANYTDADCDCIKCDDTCKE